MTVVKRFLVVVLSAAMMGACASQRPVLYPNAQLSRAGKAVADREISDCMTRAEQYAENQNGSGKTVERAGVGSVTGAAIGAAAGGAGGSITGRAGTAAAEGAVGGAAAGATWTLVNDLFRRREPSPGYRSFVDRCLREKGYEPIAWQ